MSDHNNSPQSPDGSSDTEYWFHDLVQTLYASMRVSRCPFGEIYGLSESAKRYWVSQLLNNGQSIMRIAFGVARIRGHSQVEEDDIRIAFEIYSRGAENIFQSL